MKARRRFDALAFGVLGASALLTAAVYGRLPARLAVHFDLRGNPNGWMDVEIGAWIVPAIGLVVLSCLRAADRFFPLGDASSAREARASVPPSALVVTALSLAAVQLLILYVALVPDVSVGRASAGVLGLVWGFFALVLPRARRNALFGVRTPWTLTSDEIWARTHRVAGYAFAGAALLSFAAAAAGGPSALPVSTASALAAGLVPAAYSWWLARQIHRVR
jgi:uncharacterized membrane protein